uniref:Choline transporter-like protein n=1 Tax=Amphiprion ocellaris TaxID=80972 RepID=A0A3Q1B6C1_AMPOC
MYCLSSSHCLYDAVYLLSVYLPPYLSVCSAWLHGDPRKMIHPTDSYGQFCGQKGTSNARKPILFYFNILKCTNPAVLINLQCPTTQMCVSQCPDKFATYTEMQLQHKFNKSYWEYYRQFCKPGFNNPNKVSLHGLLISLAVSLVFILLLRFTAGLLLWTTIMAALLLLAYGGYSGLYIVQKGFFFIEHGDSNVGRSFNIYKCRIVVFLTLWFLLSCRAISYIMSTLFFPVITFILLTICISYWGFIAIYLASSGEAVYKVMSPDVSCPYVNSTCNPETFYRTNISNSALCLGSKCLFAFYGGETSYHRCLFLLQLSNLFVFLWLVNFSLALEQCTLAGTFASYYWAKRKPQDIPPCPLFLSFNRAIRYHTGSLAFGALILSVAQLFRIILEYLEQRLKCVDNTLSRFLLCCLKCCFWCLEKFLRYMNCNAYIMVAIYGKNFCTSAREAFFLLMRNAVRQRFTWFVCVCVFVSGVVAFFFFTNKIPVIQEEVPSLNYYWVPILTVVIGAYLIAHSFFSIYAMCVDTLFLCFCDDLERNDGSSNKPYFMSPELHRILGKSNQIQ